MNVLAKYWRSLKCAFSAANRVRTYPLLPVGVYVQFFNYRSRGGLGGRLQGKDGAGTEWDGLITHNPSQWVLATLNA